MKARYFLTAISFCLALNLQAKELAIGDEVPDYLGTDATGEKIHIAKQDGKIVVAYFWASWCKKCISELPVLQNIQTKVGEQLIKVVAVNYKEPRRTYNQIKKEFSNFDISLTHDKKGQIGKKYGVESVPHILIVGKKGQLVFQRNKYKKLPIQQLVNALKQELASE